MVWLSTTTISLQQAHWGQGRTKGIHVLLLSHLVPRGNYERTKYILGVGLDIILIPSFNESHKHSDHKI